MREEFDGVGDTCCFCDGIVTSVVSVVFWCRAYVVARGPSVGPCEAVTQPIVDNNLASERSERCGVEVEVAMDEGMC